MKFEFTECLLIFLHLLYEYNLHLYIQFPFCIHLAHGKLLLFLLLSLCRWILLFDSCVYSFFSPFLRTIFRFLFSKLFPETHARGFLFHARDQETVEQYPLWTFEEFEQHTVKLAEEAKCIGIRPHTQGGYWPKIIQAFQVNLTFLTVDMLREKNFQTFFWVSFSFLQVTLGVFLMLPH